MAHLGRLFGPDAAGHAAYHRFDGVDELPASQRDQVGACLAHRQRPRGNFGPDLLGVRIRGVLKDAGETQPVRHGKHEQRGGLVLDKLTEVHQFANLDRQGRRCDPVGILQGSHRGQVVSRGADTTDAGHNHRHLLGRRPLQEVLKTAELHGLEVG